jgi:acyl-CoA synthetase (AMP-forming)/AMP-acid ligase II
LSGQQTLIYASPYPTIEVPEGSLTEYVFEHSKRWPERIALKDGLTGEAFSYAEVAGLVRSTASAFLADGLQPGDVVALIAPNQPWWVISLHAAIVSGAVVTPINPVFTLEEIVHILKIARATVVVADGSVAAKAKLASELVGAKLMVIGGQGTPSARQTSGSLASPSAGAALAVMPFSSGTTGSPKGVQLTHRNLVATLVQHEALYDVGPGDVVLASLPMFHIYGLSVITNYALRHGATIVTMPRFNPEQFFGLIERERVTWLHLAPPTVLLLAGLVQGERDLSTVRSALSGGAPLDPGVQSKAEAILGCAIKQGYGMTEASPGVTMVPDNRPGDQVLGSVGVLVASTEARLVDPVAQSDVPQGEVGELWVRGAQVMAGYVDNPAATHEAIVEDGWLRTGDLARVDSNGYWWVVDRLKELIKYKGYQIAPAELESILLSHPLVVDAAVVGIPDLGVGEIPTGFVVSSREGLDAEEVMAWIAGQVAPYKKLRALHIVDAIPHSPSGKTLRRELRERFSPAAKS